MKVFSPEKDFTYRIVEEKKLVEITGYTGNDMELVIPEWIEGYPVSWFAKEVFKDNRNIKSVLLPSNTLRLGAGLFEGCISLESVCLPGVFATDESMLTMSEDSISDAAKKGKIVIPDRMFQFCHSLKKMVFSDDVVNMGVKVFSNCGELKKVILPKGLKTISNGLFKECTGFTKIERAEEIETICGEAFCGCIRFDYNCLPDTIREIGERAFEGCAAIRSLKIFSRVRIIGKNAFKSCRFMESLELTNSVQIMEGAFWDCGSLRSVRVPKVCGSISPAAFLTYTKIKEIILPPNIREVGKAELLYQEHLDSLIMEGEILPKLHQEVYRVLKGAILFIEPRLLEQAEEEYKDKIAYRAIRKNDDLYSFLKLDERDAVIIRQYRGEETCIKVPEHIEGLQVVAIGEGSFGNLRETERILLPDSIEEIGKKAFFGCEKLRYIIIPPRVKRIGNNAFGKCGSLRAITFLAEDAVYDKRDFADCGQLKYITIGGKTANSDPAWEIREKFEVEIEDDYAVITGYHGRDEDDVIEDAERITLVIPEIIDGYPVFQVGKKSAGSTLKGVFAGCEEIKAISFPPSVKKIGAEAFYGCSFLETLCLPPNVELLSENCFQECTSLVSVNLQAERLTIKQRAFSGCGKLQAVAIWAKEIKMEENCFGNCSLLKHIYFHNKEEVIISDNSKNLPETEMAVIVSERKMEDTVPYKYKVNEEEQIVNIEEYTGKEQKVVTPAYLDGLPVRKIGKKSFSGNPFITEVIISEMVQDVEEQSFKDCSSLREISLPQGIRKLEKEMFSMCSSLQQPVLPSQLESIGERAFFGCVKLKEMELPDTLQKIEREAFGGCRELERIVFGDNLKDIGEAAFFGCAGLRHVMLPAGISIVRENTFRECTGLKSILYQNADCRGMEGAFEQCKLDSEGIYKEITSQIIDGFSYTVDEKSGEAILTGCQRKGGKISIPDYVQGIPVVAIADIAFAWNQEITGVVIGENVRMIGSMAFYGCENLEEIVFLHEDDGPRIYKESFYAIDKAVIYISSEKCRSVFHEDNCTCPVFCMRGVCSGIGFSYQYEREESKLFIRPEEADLRNRQGQGDTRENGDRFCKTDYPWDPIREKIKSVVFLNKEVQNDSGSVRNKENICCVYSSSFEDCKNLSEVMFTDGILKICRAAFKKCSSLADAILPRDLKMIGEEAFFGCSSLSGTKDSPFYFPDTLEKIDKRAFFGCAGLTYLLFPKSVKEISARAFQRCEKLSEICMEHEKSPEKIEGKVFYEAAEGCELSIKFTDAFMLEEKFDNKVVIHMPSEGRCGKEENDDIVWRVYYDGLLEIKGHGEIADYNGATPPWNEYSAQIKKIIIEENITHVGAMAFHSCGVKSVEFPETLESIGMEAFAYCVNLTSVKIPSRVTKVGNNSFKGCESLEEVMFMTPGEECRLGNAAFRGVKEHCVFYVSDRLFGQRIQKSYPDCIVRVWEF